MHTKISDEQARIAIENIIHNTQRQLFGERFVGCSFSTIQLEKSLQEKIASFLSKPRNFLVYCGNAGIGKTYFCSAMIEWIIPNFRCFRYWNENNLLKRVRSSMDEFKGDYLDCLKYLIDDDIVILDDIGSSGLNDWRKEVLFAAIDDRYSSMKPTILISNFTKEEFKSIFHPRFTSRIFAKENTILENHDGIDLRAEGK